MTKATSARRPKTAARLQGESLEGRNYSRPVRIDWKRYFFDFMEKHGDPVNYRGRLLFQDGWQYSSTDYRGPEWEPPKDENELRDLILNYWNERKKIVRMQLNLLHRQIRGLEILSRDRDVQLTERVKPFELAPMEAGADPEKVNSVSLDLEGRRRRIELLQRDLEMCRRKIEYIKDGGVLNYES